MIKRKVILSTNMVLVLLVSMFLPTSASISPSELTLVYDPFGPITETIEVYLPSRPPKADVVFAFDLTGSMGEIIGTAKAKAEEIMAALDALSGVDIHYGVMSYMDYPGEYSSCGYSFAYGDADSGDYAYHLDQAITDDTLAVSNVINGLSLGWGVDGPQDYTRVFYESYADPNVSWRPGAKRILVNFGDNVPHDCNLNEGVPGAVGIYTTGCDPGRDKIAGTADDLDLQIVLAEMATNGVVLLESHASSNDNEHWAYWTGLTGGEVFITSASTLVEDILEAVTNVLEAPVIYDLHLEASAGYEAWLVDVLPGSYEVVAGVTDSAFSFEYTIQVPDGTAPGIYSFSIRALDRVGVNYGEQEVKVVVYGARADYVTGGGWIDSPEGAYPADPSLAGKATFGFVSKYRKGADVPTGSTEFQFHPLGLNFHSSSYDWLGVNVSSYAIFKGSGTINDEGEYKFMLWAGDSDPDTLRIKIWMEDEFGIETVIYDNGFDQAIGGGSIVIHTKKE
jgi:hypothetical protein